jgi:hypothetical protein
LADFPFSRRPRRRGYLDPERDGEHGFAGLDRHGREIVEWIAQERERKTRD